MARPKASEHRDTRRDILDAALELFAAKGFYGTSLRDIARAVGVRESALYNHFPSKESLFESTLMPDALVGEMPLQLPQMPANRLEVQGFFERLATLLIERFLTLKERKRFRIMLTDGIRLASEGRINYWEKLGAQRQALAHTIGSLQASGLIRAGDVEMLVIAFISPIMLLRQMAILSPDHPFISNYREFARGHAEQFVRGAVAVETGLAVEAERDLHPARK